MTDPFDPFKADSDLPVEYDDRHEAIPQAGCNMCVCGLRVDDDSAHWRANR